jgi:hypothetical protein
MSNINEAIEMVQFFHHGAEHSSLKGIEAAHSSYQQLTIDNNRAIATMNTVQAAKQIKEAAVTGGDGCVVKAVISNIVYPIYIDALYQVFSKYGNVLKIVLIQKSNLNKPPIVVAKAQASLNVSVFFLLSFADELGALIQMKDETQVQQAINVRERE